MADRQGTKRRASPWLLAGILILGFLLRAFPLTWSHFWDETVFVQNALVMMEARSNYDEFSYRPPVLPIFFALGFSIWNHLYMANLVEGVLTTLVILFGFLYTRRAFGEVPALLAALLFAFTPYFVERSHELLTGMPAIGFMLAAMYAFERPGARGAVAAGALLALAAQTRFTSLSLMGYFLAHCFFHPKRTRDLVPFLGTFGLALLPYLAWAHHKLGSFDAPFRHARNIVTKWNEPVPASFYFEALLDIYTLLIGIGLAVAVGTLLFEILGELRQKRWRWFQWRDAVKRPLVLLAWGVVFLLYMLSIPHKEVRYLSATAIAVIPLSALGLYQLISHLDRRRPLLSMALLTALIAGFLNGHLTVLRKLGDPWVDDRRDADVQIADYLVEIAEGGETVYASTKFPVLAFYTGLPTVSLLPIQESFATAWPTVMTRAGFVVWYRMGEDFEDHSRHEVLSPTSEFLDGHEEFVLLRDFPGAKVYRYEPRTR